MTVLNKAIPLVAIALFVCGCASLQKELLSKDYLHMNNDDLLTYYDNLSSEIARCEGGGDRAAVGVGGGTAVGGHAGVSLGVSHAISTCNADKLRKRRIEVKKEMERRGLKT